MGRSGRNLRGLGLDRATERLVNALDRGNRVESCVEAPDLGATHSAHHREMQAISRRQRSVLSREYASAIDVLLRHLRRANDHCFESLVGGVEMRAIAKREISMQDLLERLRAGDQYLAR